MKNITLSVDDDVLAQVRRHAAEHETSVNALVRQFLTDLAQRESRARQARQRMRELSRSTPARSAPREWTREDLHERR
ncbi:MAG: ribbon-helix-helix protein, CopG family [Acidobacteria bacterium]|nr:MAG: ribbon-helix-helix protein, CopG family [Acidobacteriota bacterium]REK01103.1 MAG: ribbon-helix-helix protein, CopG family [Acidobacteriota bacterium]